MFSESNLEKEKFKNDVTVRRKLVIFIFQVVKQRAAWISWVALGFCSVLRWQQGKRVGLVVDRLGKVWLEVSLTLGLVVLEKYLAGAMWKRGQIWERWVIGGVEELLWPTKPA